MRQAATTDHRPFCLFRLAGVAALLGLTACASLQPPPSPQPADPTPTQWTAAATSAHQPTALAAWWARFGDPALGPLIAQALQDQTDIAAAAARLRQARAARDLAAAQQRPSLGGSASAQASGSEGRATTETYRAALDASWEADLWGAGAAGVQAAEATLQARGLTLAHTRISIAAEVALNLLQLRGAQAREAIAQDNLASQQQTLQIVLWRFEAGLVTQLDVEQARTAVAQTEAQIPALRSSAAQAMNALAVLTGRAPGALHAQLQAGSDAASGPAAPPDLAVAIPAEVLRQRPDVQAAERTLAAAEARVQQADAGRLPSLSLGGSIGLSALSLGGLGSGAGVASLLASVSLPVLDGGRLRAQVGQQAAARDEAAATYRATVLAALQEVEDTLVALAAAREQAVALQSALASASSAAALAEQRYRSGLVDFQNVLLSQRTRLSAQDSLAANTTTLATTHVRLYKALGGGWTPDMPPEPAR